MEEYVKKLDFDSDTFEQMKQDMNFVLQRLLGNMIEKGSYEGSMTVKIDVNMTSEYIPNFDPDIEGETRECRKPAFKHKVTSAVKISEEKSGNFDTEMEMMMDDETGNYILKPISNTSQRTIFDADFTEVYEEEEEVEEQKNIEGVVQAALPAPSDADDITDEFMEYEE